MSNPAPSVIRSLLADLEASTENGFIKEVVKFGDFFYELQTPVDHERSWIEQYILIGSNMAMYFSRQAPTLAICIRRIGKSLEDLQTVESMFIDDWNKANANTSPEEMAYRAISGTNAYARQYFFADRLRTWLSNRPPQFVTGLWALYSPLEARQQEAGKLMGKSLEAAGTCQPPKVIPRWLPWQPTPMPGR
jgi:hypothetical protein